MDIDAGECPEVTPLGPYSVEVSASVLLVQGATTIPGRLTSLGRFGCRVTTSRPVREPSPLPVEITFALHRVALRLPGVAHFVGSPSLLAVQFLPTSARRREEFEVLLKILQEELGEPEPREHEAFLPGAAAMGTRAAQAQGGVPESQERRSEKRHVVDGRATILLIGVLSRLPGWIVDVSRGGCRIHMDDKFPVGIYRRVEIEFVLDGMPFRIPGVTQVIHTNRIIGVRFLDVSQRKQEQLDELIAEIEEMRRDGSWKERWGLTP